MYDGEKESMRLLQQTPSCTGSVSLRAVARVSLSLAILFVYHKVVLDFGPHIGVVFLIFLLVLFVPISAYKVLLVHYQWQRRWGIRQFFFHVVRLIWLRRCSVDGQCVQCDVGSFRQSSACPVPSGSRVAKYVFRAYVVG